VADWLTRYRRYSADRLSGVLRWAPIVAGLIVAVTTGGNLLEHWVLDASADSASSVIGAFAAVGVACIAGSVTTVFFFAFILGLYLLTEHLAQRSE
jgi:hypothetical protein